ncbi:hypothetical protein [Pedobacter montanisoli]|uniref:Uncharacterized protein n=1 Tax=Pedobacter montanisoli TaxID=2923277 RepID=A0ABS9ZWX4_9SPHI|nr:hypothetical protein [Pedobacter montanisoli]MCJ0742811.1 hypothetical protein [Pedobacter montanisoli]
MKFAEIGLENGLDLACDIGLILAVFNERRFWPEWYQYKQKDSTKIELPERGSGNIKLGYLLSVVSTL